MLAAWLAASYGSIKEMPVSNTDHGRVCGCDAYAVRIVGWVGQWLACVHDPSVIEGAK
jgi:hypothetical protein